MSDAADTYDFDAFFQFIGELREGYDLVMGCLRGGCGLRTASKLLSVPIAEEGYAAV